MVYMCPPVVCMGPSMVYQVPPVVTCICPSLFTFAHTLFAAVARLVKDVFESAAGIDAVGAVSDYLRSQRVTSLPDLQVSLCHRVFLLKEFYNFVST